MKNPLSGLVNRYSISLLLVTIASPVIGFSMLYFGNFWGMTFLILAWVPLTGFRKLSPAPREVGVLTVLGTRTNIVVEGITLIFSPFGFEIVGLQTFVIKKEEKEFPIESARCHDGARMKGKVSLSVMADATDDSSETPSGKTSAQKLWDWYDIGEAEGFFTQVNDIIIVGVQNILEDGEEKTYRWAETHPTQIASELLGRIKTHRPIGDNDELDDTRGLGGKITKLQIKLTPVNQDIIKADEDKVAEMLAREAELRDTETVNKQAMARKKMYEEQGLANVDIKACREEIMFERLAKDSKVTIVQGGRLVNLGTVGNTDRR